MIYPQNNLNTKDVRKRGAAQHKCSILATQQGALAPALNLGVPKDFSLDAAEIYCHWKEA